MIEFEKLMKDGCRMAVVIGTEFEEMRLVFKASWNGNYADVILEGDGWAVWADFPETKNALSAILSDLTRDRYERLKALGALPAGSQRPCFLTKLDEMDPARLVSLKKAHDMARKTVNTLVKVKGEKCLVLPGREGDLVRTFIKYSSGKLFEAKICWEDFAATLDGAEAKWGEVDPGWIWTEATIGLKPQKALRFLKEMDEEGFRVLTATVLARKMS